MELPILKTYIKDGRMPIEKLYLGFETLINDGWIYDLVCDSAFFNGDDFVSLPVPVYITRKKGQALWIISGIHGEEPAGPNAIAQNIDIIREIGKKVPVVLFPICNLKGYVLNWRYINISKYDPSFLGISAGDSEHYLLNESQTSPRKESSSCKESHFLTSKVLEISKSYIPKMVIDLHEDNLIDNGYIYSQGKYGTDDKYVKILLEALKGKISLKLNGKTRFGEKIVNGVVCPQKDGSIDELLASEFIFKDGRKAKGPFADTVFVIETPAKNVLLSKRVYAMKSILETVNTIMDKYDS